jgi:hypothetical protein
MMNPDAWMKETIVAWGDDSLASVSQSTFPDNVVRQYFSGGRENARG